MKRYSSPTVRREDYWSREDYLRAQREAGGPTLAEVDAGDCDPLIWGSGNFGEIVLAEACQEQRQRPHVFTQPYRGGRPRRR
jgi:hypothetical protein